MYKLQGITNFLDFLERICLAVCTVSLLAIMSLTTVDILARKIINHSIPSLYEFTMDYLMVSLVFLALSHVYVKGGHVRVTLFLRLVPKAIRPVLDRLLDLCALVLFVIIAIQGWNNAFRAFQLNEFSSSVLPYPVAPAYFLVAIGAGMLAIRIIQSLIFPQRFNLHQETSAEVHSDEEISS